MYILQIIIAKMNCGLLGDLHECSPHRRIHTLRSSILSSGLRSSCCRKFAWTFSKVWCVSTRYAEIVLPLRVVLVVDIGFFERQVSMFVLKNSDPGSFLQQRVSSHFRSTLHLLATLENLVLRHFDLNPSSGWFPCTLCYEIRTLLTGRSENHQDDWMHSSSAL